jgi:hypothetical protein
MLDYIVSLKTADGLHTYTCKEGKEEEGGNSRTIVSSSRRLNLVMLKPLAWRI